ncbi:substrate-binding domain-containing protein [Chthonobacter albigriseus]|uniref:substrate-binding domain-containing protein n=1 Tax=Chthonobacter albigriseus TaxID=1683161 RepID=UPI0031402767
MKLIHSVSAIALAAVTVSIATGAEARDQIRIVGSSTVFPYTQAVAEQFAAATGSAAPVVESTGTGGGFKAFCGGVGVDHADITGASRAIKDSEVKSCAEAGVTSITEVLLGYDGLSVAHARSGKELSLTKAQLFQALAAKVEVDGQVVDNPYKKWSEIDASLPDSAITVFGPPPTSGTRDAFVELVMHPGCDAFPAIKALEGDAKKEVCERMRQDGPFVEAGENDNLIVQRLEADPTSLGIFGYSFLYENQDKLIGTPVDGVAPSTETIADGSYAVSRPLYIYVKNAHRGVIPGMDDFLKEYTSEAAFGEGGYLAERGLIPLSPEKREEVRKATLEGTPMAASQ